MRITGILNKEDIKVYLEGNNKKDVIFELADIVLKDYPENKRKEAAEDIYRRELNNPTAIGGGVAIPHGLVAGCQDLIIGIGLAEEPLDFEAPDKEPVKLIILVLSTPEHTGRKIRFLARVSRLLNDHSTLKDQLVACKDSGQLFETLSHYEDLHFT